MLDEDNDEAKYEHFLRLALPVAASLLRSHVDNLVITNPEVDAYRHYSDFRDVSIAQKSVIPGSPESLIGGVHSIEVPNFCCRLMQCRGQKDLQYVYFNAWSEGRKYSILFGKKKQIFRIHRHAQRQSLKAIGNKKLVQPILDKEFMDEIIDNTIGFYLKKEVLADLGVVGNRGVVLNGPPGNGKTMLCRYIKLLATKQHINVMSVTASILEDAFKRNSTDHIMNYNGIVFFDDIDISYFNRSMNGTMACALLAALDSINEAEDGNMSIRIFTTNEDVKQMDKAFIRPGRIDRIFTLELPSSKLRQMVLGSWPQKIKIDVSIDKALRLTEGMSFAQLQMIKTFMAQNFIYNGNWDFKAAVDIVMSCKPATEKTRLGFQ